MAEHGRVGRRFSGQRSGRRARPDAALPGIPSGPGWLVLRDCPVGGGGRRNPAVMRALRAVLPQPVRPAEAVGWDGDALEAQAFGVLAARVARGLPITFPGTTGAPRPLPGGRLIGRLP